MRRLVIGVSTLLLLSFIATQAMAQDTPKPETEQPKNSVDKFIDDARARGEKVLGTCLDNCGETEEQANGDLKSGRALELPKPAYPPIAAAAHASGDVKVQVVIDKDGTVIAAAAIGGHPLLQATSVTAARGARFAPSLYKGEPVMITGVLVYHFVAPE